MKTELKDILEKLTTYFDSLFKDRKIKIIILCSIVAVLLVSIISCFAISSSAAEPSQTSSPPSSDSGLFLNEYTLLDGSYMHFDSLVGSKYGFVVNDYDYLPFDSISEETTLDGPRLNFLYQGNTVYYYLGTSKLHYVVAEDSSKYGFTLSSSGRTVVSCSLSMPFNLVGYWRNLGGWTVPPEYAYFYVNGRILNSEWLPNGYTFDSIYFGFMDDISSEDYITFSGAPGDLWFYSDTPFYFHITSLNSSSRWFENAYLCYELNLLGSDFYESPPNVRIIESGYYSLRSQLSDPSSISSNHTLYIDFTCPLNTVPDIQYTGISFSAALSDYQFETISYLSGSEEFDVGYYDIERDFFLYNTVFEIIKIEDSFAVTLDEYSLFMHFFERLEDEQPVIDYENGYNHGFNNGLSQSFFLNFFKGIIEGLDQLTIFYGFSFLTIIRTVLGFCVLLWILKLIAGG